MLRISATLQVTVPLYNNMIGYLLIWISRGKIEYLKNKVPCTELVSQQAISEQRERLRTTLSYAETAVSLSDRLVISSSGYCHHEAVRNLTQSRQEVLGAQSRGAAQTSASLPWYPNLSGPHPTSAMDPIFIDAPPSFSRPRRRRSQPLCVNIV